MRYTVKVGGNTNVGEYHTVPQAFIEWHRPPFWLLNKAGLCLVPIGPSWTVGPTWPPLGGEGTGCLEHAVNEPKVRTLFNQCFGPTDGLSGSMVD